MPSPGQLAEKSFDLQLSLGVLCSGAPPGLHASALTLHPSGLQLRQGTLQEPPDLCRLGWRS